MSRVSSSIRLFLFRHQYKLSASIQNGLRDFCCFCIKVYVKYWFTCENPLSAARNDLHMLKDIKGYHTVHSKISQVALTTMMRHLWYLGEINIGFAFFDDEINISTKTKMIASLKSNSISKGNKIRSKLQEKNVKKAELWDFISVNTMVFFEILNVNTDFLRVAPKNWKELKSYKEDYERLKNIKVVNDLAERCVSLMSEFNNSITSNEDQKQYLLQVVEQHRNLISSKSKTSVVSGIKKMKESH